MIFSVTKLRPGEVTMTLAVSMRMRVLASKLRRPARRSEMASPACAARLGTRRGAPGPASRPTVPRRPDDPGDRTAAVRGRRAAADPQPARPLRTGLVRHRRSLSRSGRAADPAGPLRVPDALFAGRA